MDREKVARLVDALDAEVPTENARVLLQVCGGGPDESHMIGTLNGYLRLGIEILRGAVKEPAREASIKTLTIALESVIDEGSDVRFDSYEIRDELPLQRKQPEPGEWIASSCAMVGCGVVGVIVIAIVTLGIIGLGRLIMGGR